LVTVPFPAPVPVSVPAPVPVSVPAPVPVSIPDSDLFCTGFQQKKICSKSGLSNAKRSFVSQKAFFDICIKFYVGPGPNPVPDPEPESEYIKVPVLVPLKQKVAGPSVPVLATVPRHC